MYDAPLDPEVLRVLESYDNNAAKSEFDTDPDHHPLSAMMALAETPVLISAQNPSESALQPSPPSLTHEGKPVPLQFLTLESPDAPHKIKFPVGRPCGTGPRQLAKARGELLGMKKKPPGRPRKNIIFGTSKSAASIKGLHVSGTLKQASSAWSLDSIRLRTPISAAAHSPDKDIPLALALTVTPEQDNDLPLSTDEDSSRILDGDIEESDVNALLKEGIGEEVVEDEDEEQITSGMAPSKVSLHPLPNWLKDTFEKHIRDSGSINRIPDGLPPLYCDQQTFWFPKPSTFFLLQDIDNLSPQKIYKAQFFLWDPECLVSNGLICPNEGCSARLQRHGHIPRPRRVVGLGSIFWIIGYRYFCAQCKKPRSVTFWSWDPRILAILPRPLAAEFPAQLTYRSGISIEAFRFMRTCFSHGMGAKQFSNALLVQHLESYDHLQLLYLHVLAPKAALLHSMPTFKKKFKAFFPFHNKSSDSFYGFVPSGQWLRDVYDTMISEHEEEFNQHTAMLTTKICAIDHSFKLVKHISKVDGVQVFTALLTITNEKGEIRVCALVATKSHSQFVLALHRLRESLEMYGHDAPAVFYTDNMADKEFLEKCFPFLWKDVLPIEEYSHLEALTIPENYQISVKKSATTIDNAMHILLDFLPDEESGGFLVIGLDAKWNVKTSQHGYVTGRGQTAILQIAHGTSIFILQIGQMIAGNWLPTMLKQVLANPRILKVGRHVAGDLKYLEQACHSDVQFVGAVDIARLAEDWLLVSTACASLAKFTAVVLNRHLSKNVVKRVSTAWEDENITSEQICYAALDAYASFAIYIALLKIPTPQALPEQPVI
ncbi:hypothetical protein C0992_001133 [Termitomyces sp. T32_za158]|nr:hypothetical protein C0992_001133 [Termitomyces sp. T32_za158]